MIICIDICENNKNIIIVNTKKLKDRAVYEKKI